MPKTTRTFMPVAALTLCLLAGCSGTSTPTIPTVSDSSAPTAASAAPASSSLAPSASGMPSASGSAEPSTSGSPSETALTGNPATLDRPAGFLLPTGVTPIGTTGTGGLITGKEVDSGDTQLAVYDPAGALVWTSGPAPLVQYDLALVGTKIYGLAVTATAASGLSTGGSKYATVVFDTTKPNDPGVTTPTTQTVVPLRTDGENFTAGTTVYDITGTDTDPYASSFSVDLTTGAVKQLSVPAKTVMVAGIDPDGVLITLQQPTPADDITGLSEDVLTNGSWSVPIANHYTYQGPTGGDAVTKMGIAADDLIGYTPTGGSKTRWIDGTGKTVLTTDNDGPLMWSPNKLWVAAGDEVHNLKNQQVYRFPATGGTAAAKFIAIDNDGVALTLGADGASVVQVNTSTGATKTLAPKADFNGIDRFGDWTRYKYSTIVGGAVGDVMVPPTK